MASLALLQREEQHGLMNYVTHLGHPRALLVAILHVALAGLEAGSEVQGRALSLIISRDVPYVSRKSPDNYQLETVTASKKHS